MLGSISVICSWIGASFGCEVSLFCFIVDGRLLDADEVTDLDGVLYDTLFDSSSYSSLTTPSTPNLLTAFFIFSTELLRLYDELPLDPLELLPELVSEALLDSSFSFLSIESYLALILSLL